MSEDGKMIWQYHSPDGSYQTHYYEMGNGIILGKPEGVAAEESVTKFLEFLTEYVKNKHEKVRLLLDTRKTTDTTPGGKKAIKKLFDANSPVNMLAIVGGNFAIRCLVKLYSVVSKIQLNSFKTEEEAVSWLLQRGSDQWKNI